MQQEIKTVKINKFIDTKPMMGNLEADSFMIFMGSLALAGLLVDTMLYQLLIVLAGAILTKLHSNSKDKLVRGFFKHLVYSIGLQKTKKNIPYHQRYFVGA